MIDNYVRLTGVIRENPLTIQTNDGVMCVVTLNVRKQFSKDKNAYDTFTVHVNDRSIEYVEKYGVIDSKMDVEGYLKIHKNMVVVSATNVKLHKPADYSNQRYIRDNTAPVKQGQSDKSDTRYRYPQDEERYY